LVTGLAAGASVMWSYPLQKLNDRRQTIFD